MFNNKILFYNNILITNEPEVLSAYLYERFNSLAGLIAYKIQFDLTNKKLVLKSQFDYQYLLDHNISIPFSFDKELDDLVIDQNITFINTYQANYRQGWFRRYQNHSVNDAHKNHYKLKF